MSRHMFRAWHFTLVAVLVLALAATVLGQGRGGGRGGGPPGGVGGGPPAGIGGGPPSGIRGGPPSGAGVDFGLGTASRSSGGRSDRGLGRAAEASRGRSEEGLARARVASLRNADKELAKHPGIPPFLEVSANDLRAGYQEALLANPDLRFGQYVAATRLEQNLNRLNPNVTRDALLDGLVNGRSIGRSLQDLGLSDDAAFHARKQAEREIREAKKKK